MQPALGTLARSVVDWLIAGWLAFENLDIFSGFELIETDPFEAWAANTLKIGNSLLIPAGNPKTGEILESRGFNPVEIEISELQKAEAGLTCLSLVFESEAGRKEER